MKSFDSEIARNFTDEFDLSTYGIMLAAWAADF